MIPSSYKQEVPPWVPLQPATGPPFILQSRNFKSFLNSLSSNQHSTYQWYIDDRLAKCAPCLSLSINDENRSLLLSYCSNSCHKPLQCKFSNRAKSVLFLDLTISLDKFGTIHTTIYETITVPLFTATPSPYTKNSWRINIRHHILCQALCTITADKRPFIKKFYTRLLVLL